MECKKTLCRICSFGCLMDAWVEDGVVCRVSPDQDTPTSRKFLCAKGYATRPYIYHKDRVLTPLKRVGERGEGVFEPISWDEALDAVAQGLNRVKEAYGPEAVAFYSGYTKWYRWLLHRLCHSFGSPNYGTESSACFQATVVASKCSSGLSSAPDLANAGCVLAWGYNPDYSNLPMPKLEIAKAHGAKIVIVDPKLTSAAHRLADIHLRPMPGTDGALALGFGRYLIEHGLTDPDFIEKYVVGFPEYAAYVRTFTPEKVAKLTGVGEEDFLAACRLLEHGPMAVSNGNAGIIHHVNGVQTYRAIDALVAITGGFGKVGGNRFSRVTDPATASPYLQPEFIDETRPGNARPKLGTEEFPVWSRCIDQIQAMTLPRAILEGKPYPVRAVFAAGFNARLFPENQNLFRALGDLDFFVDVDIFMNDTAKYADIILPACTSLERRELTSSGQTAIWREPAIQPLGQSRSDGDIFCDVASRLGLDDPVLTRGYDACCAYVLRDLPFTLAELRAAGTMDCGTAGQGELIFYTPTGKYELASSLLKQFGYPALPEYTPPLDEEDPELPFIMCSGGRLPGAFASRFHRVSWTRQALRPQAAVDIHPSDAEALEIRAGDRVEVFTAQGTIACRANPTYMCLPGVLHLYHGYAEADVNSLLSSKHLDPISGFPGYRSFRCGIRKKA